MIRDKLFPATVMPDRNWWQTLWPDPDGVIRPLRIKPGMTVVDLGCGYGYFSEASAIHLVAQLAGKGKVNLSVRAAGEK